MSNELTVVARGAIAERELDAAKLLARWQEGRSPETQRAYESDLAHFAQWLQADLGTAGEMRPGDAITWLLNSRQGLANETARGYRSSMVEAGLAPATVNRRLAALRSVVSLANEFGFVPWKLSIKNVEAETYRDTTGPGVVNVVRLIKLASAHTHRPKALRDVALLTLLYTLGLRRNEALSLDLAHFDNRGAKVQVQGKRKRQRTAMSLSPTALKALRSWVGVRGREPGPLFVSFRNGVPQGRLTGDALRKLMAQWGEELDVVLRPHGLRHTAITEVLDRNKGDVRKARKFSRHAKFETLLIYDDNRDDVGGDMSKQIALDLAEVIDGMETGNE